MDFKFVKCIIPLKFAVRQTPATHIIKQRRVLILYDLG